MMSPERSAAGDTGRRHEEDGVNTSRRTRIGRILALGVVPALVVGMVLGPQTSALLRADIDLPVPVAELATWAAVLWLVAAVVGWVALRVAGEGAHPDDGPHRRGRVAASAIVVVLLLAGTLTGSALGQAGCGHGRAETIGQLVPLGGVRATFSEDDIKDNCHAMYTTTAAPDDVLAHHGGQLTARGWTTTPSDPTWVDPFLQARRGDLTVYVSVNRINGENLVQLSASRTE